MLHSKESRLRDLFRDLGSCIVAFSGGVDSSYLAFIANQELGPKALIVTAQSASYPTHQRKIALALAEKYGFHHEIIASGEMDEPNYTANPANRCYFCKHELYSLLQELAVSRGFRCVVDGNNQDDTADFRPGRQAGSELSVRSPLIEVGLGKDEIRQLSREHGLPTWNQAASACLSSRIPYGSAVTPEKLSMIDRSEEVIRSLGFHQFRVRHHGDVARIEFAVEEMPRALKPSIFETLGHELRRIGFRYVAVDVEGYRTGALNEGLVSIRVPLQ